jgi:Mce-associated membrane protein
MEVAAAGPAGKSVTPRPTQGPSSGPSRGTASRAPGWVVVAAVLLVILTAGAGAAAGWLWSDVEETSADDARRDEVAQVASQFATDVNTYSAQDIGTYSSRVTALLTDDFAGSFEDALQGLEEQVQTAELESEGEVLKTAVASIDEDQARVLVVADATVDSVFQTRVRHFRWEVELVRQDGTWLVDNFTPVA